MTAHNNIDKIFKDGLEDYTEKAPAFIWDNIEQELNKTRNTKNRTIFYGIAASMALILSFGAGYLFTNNETKSQIAQINNTAIEQKSDTESNNNSNNFAALSATETTPKQTSENKEEIPAVIKEEKKESKSNDKPKNIVPVKEKTKVKKANSSGTLLPPMFASQSGFDASNENANSFIEKEAGENFEPEMEIKRIASLLEVEKPKEGLIYEIRQAPLPDFDDVEISNKVENAWAVGISGTPLLSYRNVQSTSNDAMYSTVNTSGLQQDYENEKPLMAYSAGVNVNYSPSSRWNIQSGLYYSETGQVVENINLAQTPYSVYSTGGVNEYSVNTSAGNIIISESTEALVENAENSGYDRAPIFAHDNSNNLVDEKNANTTNTEFIQKFEYYEVPLIVSYKIIDRKVNVNLSGGVSANFLAGNNNFLQEDNGKTKIESEIEGLKSTSYSSIIGFGVEYPIVSNISFSLNPTFRYSLNTINTNGNTYPYSFGVFTGLKYSF